MGSLAVSVVGLGNLGLPMALRLLDRGCTLTVSDLDADRTGKAVSAGAGELAGDHRWRDGEALVLIVPDDRAVEELLFSRDWLARMDPGAVLVVHSTILPATAQRLGRTCSARGLKFLDAPVSGGADRARAGDLTAMVGSTEDDLESGRDLLELTASRVVRVGPPGAGSAAKLANQLMLFSALGGAYEAIRIADSYGVTEQAVLDAASTGTGASWVSQNWGFFDRLSADYDAAGVSVADRPWRKDLLEMVAAAGHAGLGAPLAAYLADVLPDQVADHAAGGASPEITPNDAR